MLADQIKNKELKKENPAADIHYIWRCFGRYKRTLWGYYFVK